MYGSSREASGSSWRIKRRDSHSNSMKRAAAFVLLATAAFPQEKAELKYEMTTYFVGILKRGPKWTAEVTEETKKLQEGHMANIRKMADAGKLLVAGPFMDNTD